MQTSRLFSALQHSLRLAPLRQFPAALAQRSLTAAAAAAAAAAPAAPAPAPAPDALALRVTPSAQARLSALRAKAHAEGRADAGSLVVRVRVDSGGCSGFKYEFLVEGGGAQPGDASFGQGSEGGACAVVDEVSLGFLRGATLDWEESLMRSAFTIAANPNAEASCGCKMSFAAKS